MTLGVLAASGAPAVVLQTLSLDSNLFDSTNGSSTIRNIAGGTTGSTFSGSISGANVTVSFDSTARTVTITRGGGIVAPGSLRTLTITETLAGATGSPKSTNITVTAS